MIEVLNSFARGQEIRSMEDINFTIKPLVLAGVLTARGF